MFLHPFFYAICSHSLIFCILQCTTWLARGLNSLCTTVALIFYVHNMYATKVGFARHLEVLVSRTSLNCIGPQSLTFPKYFLIRMLHISMLWARVPIVTLASRYLSPTLLVSKVHASQHSVHSKLLWSKASILRMLLQRRRSLKPCFIDLKPNNYHRINFACLCT